jgi:hypothetical protein
MAFHIADIDKRGVQCWKGDGNFWKTVQHSSRDSSVSKVTGHVLNESASIPKRSGCQLLFHAKKKK